MLLQMALCHCFLWLSSILLFLFIYLFIYFGPCWVFVAARGLFSSCGEGDYYSLRCTGVSLWWLLLLQSRDLGAWASIVVARGLSSCGPRAVERRLSSCGARV